MHWLAPPFNMIVTGRTGCGKTWFILDLLSSVYRGKFNNIVIFCPTIEENKTYKRLFIEKDENVHIFPPMSVENDLNKCLAHSARVLGDEEDQALFLIDDCANQRACKTKSSELTKLGFSGRHKNISVWVLTQKYNAVVKDFRENIKMLVLIQPKDRCALKAALDENDIIPDQEKNDANSRLKNGGRLIMRMEHPDSYEFF